VVALSASVSDTIAFINQLGQVLVEGGAALTTAELIRPLEDALSDRWLSVLDEATNAPGATASSVVKAILKDKPTGGAGGSAQRDGPLDEQEKVEPSINAIELAITKAPFRAVAAALRGIDTSTATGRLDGIAEGFRGECVLAVRALLTPRPLHSKNETLALLTDLHKYLGDYFTYVLAADGTGQVPARMQKYSFLGPPDERGKVTPQGQAFLDSFTKFDLVSMDWLYAPGGLLAYLRYRNTQGAVSADPLVHPLDVYTVPDQVAALGKMIHSLLVAVGAADTVADEDTDGYTFSAWTEMYIEHLRLANDYDTLELRYDHLEHCHQLYTSALHKAGQRLRDAVFSQLPADKRIDLGVVPPGDEAPVKNSEREGERNCRDCRPAPQIRRRPATGPCWTLDAGAPFPVATPIAEPKARRRRRSCAQASARSGDRQDDWRQAKVRRRGRLASHSIVGPARQPGRQLDVAQAQAAALHLGRRIQRGSRRQAPWRQRRLKVLGVAALSKERGEQARDLRSLRQARAR
jgi:hypothetical protein